MATDQDYLLSKVDSIENRLEKHVVKIESRLDQIIDIMKTVAQLQEREANNSDDIKELKGNLKETIEAFKVANLKMHDRIDSVVDKTKIMEGVFDSKVLETVKTRDTLCDSVNGKVSDIDSKVEKYLNRGIGGWFVGSILIIALQGLGVWVIKTNIDETKELRALVIENKKNIEIASEKSRANDERFVKMYEMLTKR
jgi:hypothetical protein